MVCCARVMVANLGDGGAGGGGGGDGEGRMMRPSLTCSRVSQLGGLVFGRSYQCDRGVSRDGERRTEWQTLVDGGMLMWLLSSFEDRSLF